MAMPLSAQETEDDLPPEITAPAGVTPILEDDEIVVFGTRIRGQLTIDQPPLAEYDEGDIAAIGGSSIADIISAIEPSTGSSARGGRGGGRPVFLINGIRVSSFREFRSYPPESVAKVEVFPEEVAQRFGYSPDQRVVNIVLKPNFQSLTAEVEYEGPTAGGYSRSEQEATWLRIGEQGRLNFDIDFEDRSLLTEAERGLSIAGSPREAEFRSLLPDTFTFQAEANYARAIIESGTSLGLNGTFARNESRSLSGLASDDISVLERRSETDSYSAGLSLNQPVGDWTATFTSDLNHTNATTEIDRNDASGFDIARSRTYTAVNKATLNGFPLILPAGEVSYTLDLGFDWNRIESEDSRALDDFALNRRRLNAGVTIAAPISRRGGPLGFLGDVTLVASGGVEDLSDFGALANWSLGANWSPTDKLNFSATRIWREVAPTLTNLGSPQVDELNSPVFDYLSGETVFATVVTGGNPNLRAETQADWKFSANWEVPFWENARLQADYGINDSRDVTATPSFSAAFEQAFPGRVTRNMAGDLLAIDRRPLTLYGTRSRILAFGLNARGQIGKAPARSEGGRGDRRRSGQEGQRGNGPPGGFDPARMEQVRKIICETPEGETPDLAQLPDPMRERLLDENGQPDPTKIAAARERLCTESGAAQPSPSRGGMMNMFGGGNPNDTRARYFLSLNHTITLENEVRLAQAGPIFDQLDGFVLGSGTVPEQTSTLEAGLFWQGYGLRLSGRYTGDALLRGGDLPGSSDLFFGDLATFDVRLFANLDEVLEKDEGWLKGLRVAVVMDNVFDARRKVVDENGDTPDAYDPRRLDPTGRYLGIDIRKSF